MACVHDPRSGQQGYVDANRVIERRSSKTGRGTVWSGDSCGGFAHKQDSIVVTLNQAAFGGEIEYVGGVGTLMRRKMVALRGQRVFRTAELRRRGSLHVVLVPSHGGCSSTECWKDVPLQLGCQDPVL